MSWPTRFLLSALGLLVMMFVLFYGMQGHFTRKVEQLQSQALAAESRANDFQAEAERHKAVADGYAAQTGAQDKTIAALKARIAKLRPELPSVPDVHVPPVVPGGAPDDLGHAALDAARDELIAAQDGQISTLKSEIGELRLTISAKDLALDESFKRARSLELALQAQKSAAKAGKWMGRLQGFAVGVGVGYAGGRLR